MAKKLLLILAIVFGGLGIIFVFYWINTYNSIMRLDEQVTAQWANVETAYQRRADLIPNLVNTVKGAADFEQNTLTEVVEARAQATSINLNSNDLTQENIQRFQQAQGELSGALSRLLVTVERYPELKATQNFAQLQNQLEGTENRISVERRKYNEAARALNTKIRFFFSRIVANSAGITEPRGYFKADEGSEDAPDVEFEF